MSGAAALSGGQLRGSVPGAGLVLCFLVKALGPFKVRGGEWGMKPHSSEDPRGAEIHTLNKQCCLHTDRKSVV